METFICLPAYANDLVIFLLSAMHQLWSAMCVLAVMMNLTLRLMEFSSKVIVQAVERARRLILVGLLNYNSKLCAHVYVTVETPIQCHF